MSRSRPKSKQPRPGGNRLAQIVTATAIAMAAAYIALRIISWVRFL